MHKELETINLIGTGTIGKQLCKLFLDLNFKVYIFLNSNDSNINLKSFLRENYENKNLIKVNNFNDLKGSITIESISEDILLKRKIFDSCPNKSNYFSNSSSINIKEINESVEALHFFNPVFELKIIETTLTDKNSETEYMINKLYENGYSIINTKNIQGYVGNFLLFSEISNYLQVLEKKLISYNDLKILYKNLYNGRSVEMIIKTIGVELCFKIFQNLQKKYKNLYIPNCFKEFEKIKNKNFTNFLKLLKK